LADEQYLTPAQVATELQVTTITVRRWITSGQLVAAKAGPRKWMIRRSDLDQFLAGGGERLEAMEPSDDPSFRKHLVAPDDR
jgi:excisionase family DNA binding protein